MQRRDFPIIELAPWEHLPSCAPDQIQARAQNVEPFVWRGRTMQLAARFADVGDGARYLFLSDVSSQEEGNWILSRGWHDDLPHALYGGEKLKLPHRLESVKDSHNFPFGRLFHLRGEEIGVEKTWRAFVAANGSGCWLALREGQRWETEADWFRLPVAAGESLLDWSARDLGTVLLQHVANRESDVRFALNWAHLNQFEQEDHALYVRRGTVAELRALLACALTIEPQVQKHVATWSWDVEREENRSNLSFRESVNSMGEWAPTSSRLRAWKRELLTYFAPDFDAALRRRHVCVRKSTGNYDFLLRLEVQTPSHHERMEAALELCDWARDKIAPRKLALLLGAL